MRNLIFPIAILAMLVGFAISTSKPAEEPIATQPKVDLAKLETLAQRACLCEFNGGKSEECNTEFTAAVSGIALERFDSACAPISSEILCLPGGPPNCFVTSYPISTAGGFVCSEEQADTLGAIWMRAQNGKSGSTRVADNALRAALRKMQRGEKVSRPKGKTGCT